MDKSLPDQLVLSYTKLMMGFLLFNEHPEHIGMIGLGGGSLPKYCYRHLPLTRISIAEISSEVIALRTYFQIPKDNGRFNVFLEDGAEFVRRHPCAFDVLMVDGFDIKGQPPQLCSQTFYEDCYRALAPNGILVVNLCDWGYKLAMWRMRQVFEEVFLCDCPDGTNRIAFAMKSDVSNRSLQHLMRRSNRISLLHPVDLGSVALQFISSEALIESVALKMDGASTSTCRSGNSLAALQLTKSGQCIHIPRHEPVWITRPVKRASLH